MKLSLCGVSAFAASLGIACQTYPANFVPLTSTVALTDPNSAGDRLVVGALQGGVNSLSSVPLPAVANDTFCGTAQIRLSPQSLYPASSVYVPTAAERSGNFSAFSGQLLDPATGQPFPGGIIPASRLGSVFAWRVSGLPVITSLFRFTIDAGPGMNPSRNLCPGMLVYLFGINTTDASGKVSVFVNGASALVVSTGPLTASNGFNITNLIQIPRQTAVGPASFQISVNGRSSPIFTASISQYSPLIFSSLQGTLGAFHAGHIVVTDSNPAKPGEKITIETTGLGAADPPTQPSVTVNGVGAPVTDFFLNQYPGNTFYFLSFVVPALIGPAHYPAFITIGGVSSNNILLPIGTNGLSTSQTGVTFREVTGSSTVLQRTVSVISGSDVISWNATATTISGGTWLQVSPASGTSDPALTPPSLAISATASTLAPGDYYGTVSITAPNTLVVISVVLSVLAANQTPGPVVEPTGAVFVGAPGSAPPAAKLIQISNPSTAPVTFTSASTPAAKWFQFQPATGTVAPGQPVTLTVQPNPSLPAGIYTGSITLTFSDSNSRVVNLLDVVAAGASGTLLAVPESASPAGSTDSKIRLGSCAPTKLLPVLTLLGLNFVNPVAWPADIEATIVDDCGTPMTAGAVEADFSNGDAAVQLSLAQNGKWTGSWTPRNAVNANLKVTITAQNTAALVGSTTVSGASPANPNVPIINSGGVVTTASYSQSPAPGTLVSLFGTAFADSLIAANQLPLPNLLGATRVLLGGRIAPLLFVAQGQINAQLPYSLPKGSYQVFVQRGSTISTAETIAVLDGQPAVFTIDQTGTGQGHIYKIGTDGSQTLAGPASPVTAGDILTVYCSGLGEVSPASLDAGAPAPLDVLENAVNSVTVTIGGVSATTLFAGLTPGLTGLYQVNLIVPSGVGPGDAVPLILTAAGSASQPVTLALR